MHPRVYSSSTILNFLFSSPISFCGSFLVCHVVFTLPAFVFFLAIPDYICIWILFLEFCGTFLTGPSVNNAHPKVYSTRAFHFFLLVEWQIIWVQSGVQSSNGLYLPLDKCTDL